MKLRFYLVVVVFSFLISLLMFSGIVIPGESGEMFGYVWLLITLVFLAMLFMNVKKKK